MPKKPPWWAQVGADYYKKPSGLAAANAPRARNMAAVLADTHIGRDPNLAGAFLKAGVPYSTAQRINMEYEYKTAPDEKKKFDNLGVSNLTPKRVDMVANAARKQKELETANWWSMDAASNAFDEVVAKPFNWAIDTFQGVGKSAAQGVMQGGNALISPVAVPAALGRANESAYEPDQIKAKALLYTEMTKKGINPVIASLAAFGEKRDPIIGGVTGLLGITDLSEGQQKDMRSQGYDPGSFASRWSYYYDSMEAGQKPIADSDVAKFSQEYDPADVQAARQILVSNVLNDGNVDALTPEAQAFAQKIGAHDPKANELFERMAKSSTLHPGSIVADIMGLPRGEDANMIVSALSDLALYWYADPVAAGVRGLNAYRQMNRMISVGSLTESENLLLALKNPGNPASEAAFAAGKNFREMTHTAARLNWYDTAISAAGRSRNLSQFQKLNIEANTLKEQFRIRHPDLGGQLTATRQVLAGKMEGIYIKSDTDMQLAKRAAMEPGGKPFDPLDVVYTNKPKPVPLKFKQNNDGTLDQAELNSLSAQVVQRINAYVVSEAMESGRPILNGRVTLPGEIAINRQFRAAVAPYRNALIGTRSTLRAALSGKQHVIDFYDPALDMSKATDYLLGDAMGQWVRQNYNNPLRIQRGFERWASDISMSASGKHLSWSDPKSTEIYERFITPWMPHEWTGIMARRWQIASPGERFSQWRQTIDAIESAAGFKTNNPLVREFLDQLRKGLSPTFNKTGHITGPNEAYTAVRADNTIRAGGTDIAAGLYPWQMGEGFHIPNVRAMKQMADKTGVLSAVTGAFNSRFAMIPTSIWKVGKVGNPANMMRQNIELWGLGGLEQGIGYLMGMASMRRYVAGQTMEARVLAHDEVRGANLLNKKYNTNDWKQLGELFNKDKVAYVSKLYQDAVANGASPGVARALSNWNEEVWVGNMVRASGGNKAALAIALPLDWTRAMRLKLGRADPRNYPPQPKNVSTGDWMAAMDREHIESQLKAHLGDLGGSADHALMLLGQSAADDLVEASARGVAGIPVRLRNGYDWMGAQGQAGISRWHAQLDSRQVDEFTREEFRAVAYEELLSRAGVKTNFIKASDLMNHRLQAQGKTPIYPGGMDARQTITWLIKNDPEGGALLRNQNMRLFHNDDAQGTRVEGSQQEHEAIDRLAQASLRDLRAHLGEKPGLGIPVEYNDILRKIAGDSRVFASDLAKIPPDLRPESIVTHMWIPGAQKYDASFWVNMSSKAYAFTVARPLMRLGITPAFLTNRNIALRSMRPAAEDMISRGFTPEQVTGFLESGASKYAVQATFRYTDEVGERSYFSEMADNVLMFQRAAEDFMRRFAKITHANPAILSRGFLLAETAQHSGWIYPNTETDDDGNQETHLVFTFPGSGLLAKAVQEAGQAVGWGDSDLILKPLYSSMSSQVRFVNPSISNPLGFSTSPLIGMPLRLIRQWFPATDHAITGALSKMEGGGERFFAEQGPIQSLLPTPIARLVSATGLDGAGEAGQIASSARNAMAYFMAAGILPGDDATDDEKEEAQQAMKEMTINQLVWRAVVGTFSPWAPQYNEPEDINLPTVNALDHARGLNSLRSEWFDVLDAQTKKFGPVAGIGNAHAEWARRYPYGKSIVNPEALTVGATHPPGTAADVSNANLPSGPKIVQWMLENKKYLEDNTLVAFYLLPQLNDPSFSRQGYRDQIRNQLREYKTLDGFYHDLRYTVAMREYWDKVDERGKAIATGGDSKQLYEDFDKWEQDFQLAHPATWKEKVARDDPNWVHGSLAPALQKLVTSGNAPSGVDIKKAKAVWDHYSQYRAKYNEIAAGDDGKYDRSRLNKQYRNEGDDMFLGTDVENLWKAMDVYEGGF